MMTAADALALPLGAAVLMLVPTSGSDHRDQERHYPAGAVAVVGNGGSAAGRDSVTVIIGPPDAAIVNVFDQGDYEGGAFPFALHPLAPLIAAARAADDRLNDPKGDGSGDDARAPTGDDYNALFALVEASAAALIQEA